jgi:hypothetical protein
MKLVEWLPIQEGDSYRVAVTSMTAANLLLRRGAQGYSAYKIQLNTPWNGVHRNVQGMNRFTSTFSCQQMRVKARCSYLGHKTNDSSQPQYLVSLLL